MNSKNLLMRVTTLPCEKCVHLLILLLLSLLSKYEKTMPGIGYCIIFGKPLLLGKRLSIETDRYECTIYYR